jgi:hypothetical protein
MRINQAKRLKELEKENARLKRLVADISLDNAILKYRKKLWVQRIQLFNPLFWLFHFIAFVARLPFYAASKAGFDTTEAEESPLVRTYLFLFQVACYVGLAHALGVIDWLRFDILQGCRVCRVSPPDRPSAAAEAGKARSN